jgi:hypothetical protein|tara:strand:- start:198 stop:857 length:660 start_codon:yes stop_codon:yes gene_type:complete
MLKKFKDKTILVLGAGNSTLDVKWENLDYDYLWTCNQFFLLDRIDNVKVDLVTLGYNVNLYDKKLHKKLTEDSPLTLIETHHYREKIHSKELKDFSSKFDVHQIHIPLDSLAGAASRLVKLALMCDAKKVYFAGVDGFNKTFTNKHAFTGHVGLKDTDTRREYSIYYEGFMKFYKHLLDFDYSKLQNLGEGFDYNNASEISEEYFPLSEETKRLIYEKN